MRHVTGGGIPGNLVRVLPGTSTPMSTASTWAPQPIFELIGRLGGVSRAEMERTFNKGIGMLAVVAPGSVDAALALLRTRGVEAWVCGALRARSEGERGDAEAKGGGGGAVTLRGSHPA